MNVIAKLITATRISCWIGSPRRTNSTIRAPSRPKMAPEAPNVGEYGEADQ